MKIKHPNLSGKEFSYLGHFRKPKFARQGHNNGPVDATAGTVFDEKQKGNAFQYNDPPRKRQRILNTLRDLEENLKDQDRKRKGTGDDSPETSTQYERSDASKLRNQYKAGMEEIEDKRQKARGDIESERIKRQQDDIEKGKDI